MTGTPDWYQKTSDSYTALLVGEVSISKRPRVMRYLFGQQAYEAIQTYLYLDEMVRLRNDPDYICWTPGFPSLAVALELFRADGPRFVEIGSTVFASIDKLQKLRNLYKLT